MKKILLITLISVLHLSLSAQDIFRTVCQGNLARLDSILTDKSVNVKDDRERSLLHWAVACNQKDVFDYLTEKGINPNAEDDQLKTPMHMAIRFNRAEYLDLLLHRQMTDDWISTYGASLLEHAVLKKSKTFVQKLIDYGVDINGTNNRGSTALEIAQRIGATDMADFLLQLGADETLVRTFEPRGKYMGQPAPGSVPSIFAPNFISTEEYEFGAVFNAAATAFYYGVDVGGNSEIRFTQLTQGKWERPATILSHEVYGFNDPFLSPDEKRLYFISRRALDGLGPLKEDHDIWYVERTENGWSEPINAGPNINSSGNEYYISFTRDGTMYFASNVNAPEERKSNDLDIYYARFENGSFQKAIALGDSINTPAYEADVFVDPEEKYIIFCSTRAGGLGRGDLYISFKTADGNWSKSRNMGHPINTKHHELCPFVTADGKYLLYTSNEDIYWISTTILTELQEE